MYLCIKTGDPSKLASDTLVYYRYAMIWLWVKQRQVFAVYYLLQRSSEGRSLELLHLNTELENEMFRNVSRFDTNLQARGQRLLQLLSLLLVGDLQGVQEPWAPNLVSWELAINWLCHGKANLELDIVGVLLDLHTLGVLPPGLQEEVLDLLDLTGHLLKWQQFLNRDHATDQVDTGQNSGTKSFSSLNSQWESSWLTASRWNPSWSWHRLQAGRCGQLPPDPLSWYSTFPAAFEWSLAIILIHF